MLANPARPRPLQDHLLAIQRGDAPAPPSAALLGVEIVEVADGRATFRLTPAASHLNPAGTVHGGFLATLADFALVSCVNTMTEPSVVSTVSLTVNYLRPVVLSTGPVDAVARAVHVGGRLATAEATLVDAAGTAYARAVATCHVFPLEQRLAS